MGRHKKNKNLMILKFELQLKKSLVIQHEHFYEYSNWIKKLVLKGHTLDTRMTWLIWDLDNVLNSLFSSLFFPYFFYFSDFINMIGQVGEVGHANLFELLGSPCIWNNIFLIVLLIVLFSFIILWNLISWEPIVFNLV